MPRHVENHHRRSIRLKGYDYTQPGAYFITIVTWHRECLFGEVMEGVMNLSALGQIVYQEWTRSIGIRKEIMLNEDEFVIMPNHLHGIVWIVAPTGTNATCGTQPKFKRPAKSIGSFVAGFKSSVTSRAGRELDQAAIWQRNYYDHIIRSDAEFQSIWEYIDNNPLKWKIDQLHPDAPLNPFNRDA